ncbi:T9SS type A sorting domain-containing protein [Flavobacterium zhairuonense]|uniref:T9SS type A sorting domain-containing protein n=1 Tax=Flavobacterium zhairuonense TaxID=2493631 RepID=UPI001043410C|nr:T9SS type A sorting domain-containing protein [Flavobacterium zhairuonense]KAF2507682.1 T9SS type A sorting domain-containing protein [Flavobacterium zhairuonense]
MKKTLLCFLLLFSNFFYAQVTSISICAGESFNLTSLKTAFIGNLNPDETNVSYFLSEEDALNNNNVIADPTVYNGYPGVTTKIYARIDHNGVITSNYINFRVNYPLVLHTTVEPISCAKPTARITLFADGGTGPYLYSSDNGSTYTSNRFFYDLPVGTYSFNTKDALGCITSKSVTIENPAPLTITSRKNDVTCSGKANGVVWIQASGGTIPYNYYLINSAGKTVNTSLDSESNSIGFTGLTPDTYTIKVSDNYSCSTQTAQIEITEPAPLTMSTVLSSNTCGANSGSITVLAVGGTPPYIYNIDNNPFQTSNIFTNVGAGAHVIYVTDSNKCLITLITEKVEMTEAPTGILTVKDLVCHGTKEGEITINATGGQAPYQYSIGEGFQSNNTFSNLAEGEYTVTVQDAKGCSSSYTTQVLGSILMSTKIKITNSTTTNDDNGKITIVPLTGVGPFSFALTDDSGLEIRPFQKTNVFADLKSGVYGYQMKDGLGCVFSETNISVLNTPAPLNTSNVVVPMTCDTQAQIIVTANGGTSPYVYSINGGAFQSNNTFSNLTPGSYTITVKDAANTISDASSVLVTSPIPITITAANTPLACWGEKTTLTVIATGGKAPYQYSINNNPSTSSNVFANLKAENYTIKVTDAGGCINTLPYTITEPSLVDADLVIDGNTISLLNVKGGTGSYFYSIDDGTFQTNNIFTNVTPGLHHVRLKDSNNCEPGSFWAEITGPITATIAITKDIDCMSNAEIVTAASGGTAPYTYSINGVSFQSANVFSNLTEGTYSITVKDANGAVTTTNSITIAPISFPTLAFTQTNVSCSQSTDGTIIVSAAGGKAPFLYALDNSPFFPTNVFTNLVAGYYNVTVKDANGCLSSSYVVITEPTPITPTVNVKNSSTVGVNDGQITVIANGGFAPYTYALTIDGTPSSIFQPSNIFDGLQAGSYSVQVKDANGCIAMQAVSIIDGPPALIATAAATQITCTNPNGIISVTATGGTLPYTYSFDNGVTYSASNTYNGFPGTYLIKVKDAENSQASTTISLIAPTPVFATAILAKAVDCLSNGIITVSATGGQGPYLYSFDNGNTYSSNNTFSNAVAGVYSIIVKDSYGCISNVQNITVDPLVSLVATATITKEVDCINGSFRVDVTGGKSPYLYSINNEPYTASVPLFYKQAGTYTINVKDNLNCIASTVITLKPYTPVSATTIVTNATCFGTANGSIRVNASGGVTPYTYSLDGTNYQTSNIFNNVVAKTYTIRIKDSRGCTINATAIVTQPTSLVATSTIKSVTCKGFNNGSVTLTASGGKSPYTYSRDGASYSSNPNFIALTAGIYTFFVKDANNCIVTNNIAVTEPATLQLITDIKTLNNDGSIGALIQLDAAGGTAPYLYSVKNQVTGVEYGKNVPYKRYSGMPAGLYTISVIDANGCQETKSNIDITLNNPIVLNAVKAPISCIANASLSVTASGGVAPYLYSYDSGNTYTSNNPGRTNLTPGTYSILLKDAIGNEAQTHYIVKAYTPVKTIATVTYETSNGHLDGVITMSSSNGVAPYTYKVKNATTNQLIFDYSASVGYVGLPEGTYSITAKDANGCESASVDATIVLPAPIFITISNVTPITCENPGESLYINASGGVAPYLYSFNLGQTYTTINGVANLKSGLNYVFYVKDAIGNTSWISYKVKTYVPLAINLTKTNIFCNGSQDGTITATASGGTAPYTYSLGTVFSSSNVFNNLSPGQYNVTAKDAAGCTTVSSITILQPSRLSASTSVVNPSSSYNSDGRIAVNASGGVQPYTYSLRRSNGIVLVPSQTANLFANLASGSYVVEVRDALGCTFLQQGISIIAPPALVATASVNPLTCSTNGVITVTATGGTAPYSYSFNNGTTYMASNVFTTAIPGSYNIIVRDAQNSITSLFATIDPVIPVQLIATITSPVTCSQNGTITANTSGGRAPFVYSLNGGPFQSSNSFVVNAGTHIITVRDNNDCTAVVAIQLEQPQPIIADLNIENQTATITASGGTGNFQYAISPNLNVFSSNNTFTNLEAGEYTAIVQDANGCYVMLNFVINPPAPLAEGKQEALVVDVKPGSTLADLVVEGQNIKWYSAPSPSQTKTSKSTAETPLPLTTVLVDGTTYYASQTINGIESKERLAVTAKVNGSLSAPDFNLTSFQFYPNPVIDILNIENNSTIDDVEIIDISGKSVVFKRINDLHSEIDLSNLSSGVYILKVKSENKQKTIKFIKK